MPSKWTAGPKRPTNKGYNYPFFAFCSTHTLKHFQCSKPRWPNILQCHANSKQGSGPTNLLSSWHRAQKSETTLRCAQPTSSSSNFSPSSSSISVPGCARFPSPQPPPFGAAGGEAPPVPAACCGFLPRTLFRWERPLCTAIVAGQGWARTNYWVPYLSFPIPPWLNNVFSPPEWCRYCFYIFLF